jgi:hypothetical protein
VTEFLARPAKCIRAILLADGDVDFDVKVGPLDDADQQAGAVSLMEAGMPVVELYSPIIRSRVQMRAVAGSLSRADVIGRRVQSVLDALGNRTQVTLDDEGTTWIVHTVSVDGGSSMHFDSSETWETLLFASVMMSKEPIESP